MIKKHLILTIVYDKIVMFFGGLAQLARASALHAEGRGFESHVLHQNVDYSLMIASFFMVISLYTSPMQFFGIFVKP